MFAVAILVKFPNFSALCVAEFGTCGTGCSMRYCGTNRKWNFSITELQTALNQYCKLVLQGYSQNRKQAFIK